MTSIPHQKEFETELKNILKEDFQLFIAPINQKHEAIIISHRFNGMAYPLRHEWIERGLRLSGLWERLPPLNFLFFSPDEWAKESKLDH